ncbi:MAG TPA: hypothetical protein VLF40_01820 [Candidatus Saccharimonadales bacterium]|nr:hypothetical protein [Candidatus Saccharimonadales bacterium]
MKKFLLSLSAALGLVLATPLAVFAYGGNQTDAGSCGGKVVVNVTYDLLNDTDSAVGGGTWANDTISRHLQVTQVGQGMYCATVSDNGSFVTYDWSSPGGTGTVTAGIDGVMSGGYRTPAFSGALVSDPTYKTRGSLGTFDLNCDRDQNCPGAHPTVGSFVSGWNGDLAWWGWQYKTTHNGTWVNSVDGNSGDITS